ncbi:MAG TPA: DUF3450 family protein [Anaerohalosphaeraceae bacterium]|nr:DUF3450 family protein [Anaerohalosphaeraceae bacterium]HPB93648.1 DUF3450 family protein [Anaerohalosphaeraceae bacterium]HRT24442.1 DUF3450 family protein [Anaerohalosphaeraceae bacterium]HRU15681.1 DUF3450 family protein [Anaerohalosphaeraceae bacterium]
MNKTSGIVSFKDKPPEYRILGNNRCIVQSRCLLAGMVCLLCSGLLSAESDSIENTRSAMEKWIQTKRIISQEKRDFTLTKEILKQRITLVRQEIETLKGKIHDAEESIAEADKKRAELMEENDKLRNVLASVVQTACDLEKQLKQLLVQLPEPIRQRVKPLSQRLPDQPEETKQSLAERFQNIVGILNEVDKFNRDITVTSEIRHLPDGSSVEVTAFYVGLGQAYYTSADGMAAGIGTATQEGWIWKPCNKAAAQIKEAIDILKNEKPASFVHLPVAIE